MRVFCCAVWRKFHPGWFRCSIVYASSTSSVRSVFLDNASRRFSSVTILQTGRLGRGVVAGYQSQSRFQLAKPFLFRCGCGFTSGRKSSTTESASYRCCNHGQVAAIATTSEGLLDLDTITGLSLMVSVSIKTLIDL